MGERKQLRLRYLFRGRTHEATIDDMAAVLAPLRGEFDVCIERTKHADILRDSPYYILILRNVRRLETPDIIDAPPLCPHCTINRLLQLCLNLAVTPILQKGY